MARNLDPRGIRMGTVLDWGLNLGDVNLNWNLYHKDKMFIEYIGKIINDVCLKSSIGFLYSHSKIVHFNGKDIIYIYIYDGLMEDFIIKANKAKRVRKGDRFNMGYPRILSSNFKDRFAKQMLKDQKIFFAFLEKILLEEVLKYYNKDFDIYFCGLGNQTLNAAILGNYLRIRMSQGYYIMEVINFLKQILNKNFKNGLVGYKIICKGRFSRKQRADLVVVMNGNLSLNSISVFLDYSFNEVVLRYGICSIKIYLYKRKFQDYNYRIKV